MLTRDRKGEINSNLYVCSYIVYLDMDFFEKNTIISLKKQHFKNKTSLKKGKEEEI